jgi:hypothetical protein
MAKVSKALLLQELLQSRVVQRYRQVLKPVGTLAAPRQTRPQCYKQGCQIFLGATQYKKP